MFVCVSDSTRPENDLLLGAMSGQKGPDGQQAAVCSSTQCDLKPGGKTRQRQREKQINTCVELALDSRISSNIQLIFSFNDLPINPTSYLLCRWSVKVTVVQSERGTAEQKDTRQLKDATLVSCFHIQELE